MAECLHILLVEDDDADAALFQEQLTGAGDVAFCLRASSLAQALATVHSARVDLVLLDLTLPDADGLDALDRMRRAAGHLPVIALTRIDEQQIGTQAVASGAQDCLVKHQVTPQTLLRALRHAIERHRVQQAILRTNQLLQDVVADHTADLRRAVDSLQVEVFERQEAEAELRRIQQMLQMVNGCNQAMVRLEDERELMQEVCTVVSRVGGYRRACVSIVNGTGQVEPVVCVGQETTGGGNPVAVLFYEKVTNPAAAAVRTGQPFVVDDLLSEPALEAHHDVISQSRVRSLISLPLIVENRSIGALTIWSSEPEAFARGKRLLLVDMANDLAYGLESLRVRTQLWQSRELLAEVIEHSPVGIWVVDADFRYTLVEGKLPAMGGQELLGRSLLEVHARRPEVIRAVRRAMAGQEAVSEFTAGGFTYACRYCPFRERPDGPVTGVMCVATDISERKQAERELLDVISRERRRFGRDLHDGVQGNLVGMRYMLEHVADSLPQTLPQARAEVRKVADLVGQTISQLRLLARGLCPVELKSDGLVEALRQMADSAREMFGIECRLVCNQRVLMDDATAAIQLYYICQEALNNAVKHGKARRVEICLGGQGSHLTLAVVDDGVGLAGDAPPVAGMGIRTMTYRASTIGASLDFRRGGNGGMVVDCQLDGAAVSVSPPAES